MREEAVQFGGKTALLGIISGPMNRAARNSLGVILLNAGGLHRVGPNRLYVNLARRLAELGFVALRFDFAGFGDSEPRSENIPFSRGAVSDVRAAMDFLTTTTGLERFILVGICSGAEVSFEVAQQDTRVAGAVLINGRGYDPASVLKIGAQGIRFLARTVRFLFTAWPKIVGRKLRRGTWGARYTAELTRYQIHNLFGSHVSRSQAATTALPTLANRGVAFLLVYEGGTPIADYLRAASESGTPEPHANVAIEIMKYADHTFNSVRQQDILMNLICTWTRSWCHALTPVTSCDSIAI
jgi:dienelactone hydrolase